MKYGKQEYNSQN